MEQETITTTNILFNFIDSFWNNKKIEEIIEKAGDVLEKSSLLLSEPINNTNVTTPTKSSLTSPNTLLQLKIKGEVTNEVQEEFAKLEGELIWERKRKFDVEHELNEKLLKKDGEVKMLVKKNEDLNAQLLLHVDQGNNAQNKKDEEIKQYLLDLKNCKFQIEEAQVAMKMLMDERLILRNENSELRKELEMQTKLLESFNNNEQKYMEFANKIETWNQQRNKRLAFNSLKENYSKQKEEQQQISLDEVQNSLDSFNTSQEGEQLLD